MERPSHTFHASFERIVFGLTVVLVPVTLAVAGWTTQEHPSRTDRYLFEHMGETVLDGGTVYLDCWDNKPPGLIWFNALVLWIGGRSTFAVTVAAVLAAISAVAVTGWGVARVHGRAVASLTMTLFALILSQRYFDALTNGTEFYAMVAECFAAAFCIRAMTEHGRRTLLYALFAGIAWGAAGMVKQTGAAGPIAVALCVIISLTLVPALRTRWLARFFVMGAGTLLVVAAVAFVLQRSGALAEAYAASVTFNLDPDAPGAPTWTFHLPRLLKQLQPLLGVGLLAAVGAVVTFIPGGCDQRASEHAPPEHDENLSENLCGTGFEAGQSPQETGLGMGSEAAAPTPGARTLPRAAVVVLLVWIAIATYGVGLGPNHMPRYWHAVYAPGMWLVAQGLRFALDVCASGKPKPRWTATIGAVALGVILLRPLADRVCADAFIAHYYATFESERGRLTEVARRIGGLTGPDDRIYVWGYGPGLYRFSERRAACRFAGLDKLNNTGAKARAIASEIFASLRAQPPKLIAVEKHRHANLLDSRAQAVPVEGLAEWFRERYEQREAVDGFFLYVRRP